MRNLFVSALLAILILGVTTTCAQNQVIGSKKFVTENVTVESFEHIVVLGSPDIIYTQTNSGSPKVEIYGDDNIIPLIETTVNHNTLTVKFKKNTNIKNPGKLEIRVSARAMKSMKVQGSGDIHIPNGISTSDFSLKVQGSGDINGKKINCTNLNLSVAGSGDIKLTDIKTTNVDCNVNGSGDIELTGTTTNANYSVAGSGDITAHKLKADNVKANVNGSGDITCHAVKTLTGKTNGSGDVSYKGDPEISFPKKGLRKL